ncbi:class E vacuolar protein-sorting machinery protein HSE1 [Coprinopsis cinerea AmutBmut pab1-1]|nr:class E vacuolar protein-sorting machinery protein HSE1 [Coprinopsis cinerea AmutBmut pab1-1]
MTVAPDSAQSTALLALLVSQIEQNVQFLAGQGYISQEDAGVILGRLPNAEAASTHTPSTTTATRDLSSKTSSAISNLGNKFSGMMKPAAPKVQQARALWGYNEDGSDPNDLQFSAGDIIDIIEETNADWWKGRFNGKEGLLPANYVEKLRSPPPPPPAPAPAPQGTGRPYKPFGAAFHGVEQPQPPQAQYGNQPQYGSQPPPPGQGVNHVGLQDTGDQEEKKKGFGKYKSTLAHSAAGGVGFGAGAAIGGGLVRAIF